MLSEKTWRVESVFRLFLSLFAAVSVAGLCLQLWFHGEPGEMTERKFWYFTANTAVFHLVALGFVGYFLKEEGLSWRGAFGFGRCSFGRVLAMAFGTVVLVVPMTWVVGQVSAFLLEQVNVAPESQQSVQTLQRTVDWAQRGMFGFVAIVLAPMVEEILFRGILYPTIKQAGYPRAGLWGTSFFFAVTHANLMTTIPLTLLAVVLCVLYERTDDLRTPMVAHSLFNGVNFALLVAI